MTDREMLELAAKAAGYRAFDMLENHEFWPVILDINPRGNRFIHWNPLADDGDALRLAVKLEMCLDLAQEGENTFDHLGLRAKAVCHDKSDPYAATRSAIVRAAAEIGKSMP